ncbi:MAG: hypothetical protein NT069_35390 [Planctomycetota bacterium]|nr:hypothetical protein [Planctomycetota bacterium]
MNADDETSPAASPGPWERADAIGNEMLDNASGVTLPGDLSGLERDRIADLQWLDSLLEQCHNGHNGHNELTRRAVEASLARLKTEVDAVAETIVLPAAGAETSPAEVDDEPFPEVAPRQRELPSPRLTRAASPPIGRPMRVGRRLFSRLTVAAAVFLAFGIWWAIQPNPALALVDRAYQAALAEQDRTYQVLFTPIVGPAREREGTLRVRGGRRFVYTHPGPGPFGARFLIGGDSGDYWFVPPVGPALIHDQEGFIAQWMKQADAELPFLQISALLERLKTDYDLKSEAPEALRDGGVKLDRLSGRLRNTAESAGTAVPQTIHAWIDPRTGVVHQITVEFGDPSATGRNVRIRLRLTSEDELPDDYYQLSHHASRRRVMDLRLRN